MNGWLMRRVLCGRTVRARCGADGSSDGPTGYFNFMYCAACCVRGGRRGGWSPPGPDAVGTRCRRGEKKEWQPAAGRIISLPASVRYLPHLRAMHSRHIRFCFCTVLYFVCWPPTHPLPSPTTTFASALAVVRCLQRRRARRANGGANNLAFLLFLCLPWLAGWLVHVWGMQAPTPTVPRSKTLCACVCVCVYSPLFLSLMSLD